MTKTKPSWNHILHMTCSHITGETVAFINVSPLTIDHTRLVLPLVCASMSLSSEDISHLPTYNQTTLRFQSSSIVHHHPSSLYVLCRFLLVPHIKRLFFPQPLNPDTVSSAQINRLGHKPKAQTSKSFLCAPFSFYLLL